jgi:hypothetical protein
MVGRNKNAETAFAMAIRLVGGPTQQVSEEVQERLWDKCHADKSLQDAVQLYLYSTPAYQPKALHKLHQKIVEVVS